MTSFALRRSWSSIPCPPDTSNSDETNFCPTNHKRSNVESTFSMMKWKFGDGSRSKTDVATVNETLLQDSLS